MDKKPKEIQKTKCVNSGSEIHLHTQRYRLYAEVVSVCICVLLPMPYIAGIPPQNRKLLASQSYHLFQLLIPPLQAPISSLYVTWSIYLYYNRLRTGAKKAGAEKAEGIQINPWMKNYMQIDFPGN